MIISLLFPSVLPVIYCLLALLAIYYGFGRRSPIRGPTHRAPAITVFKSSTMLMTVLSILAVDFSAFPRRFVKTESFGQSLMDAGVGVCVVGMGLSAGFRGTAGSVRAAALRLIPVVVIGVGRAVAIKAVGYQVSMFLLLTLTSRSMCRNMESIGISFSLSPWSHLLDCWLGGSLGIACLASLASSC